MNMLQIIPWEVWFEDHLYFLFMGDLQVPAVDLQGNIVPENRPKPKRKGSSSDHPFSGAILVSGRVLSKERSKRAFQRGYVTFEHMVFFQQNLFEMSLAATKWDWTIRWYINADDNNLA